MLSIAARYASSLFQKAQEKNITQKILQELELFINILQKNKTLMNLWLSLSVSIKEKEELLLSKLDLSDITLNFLKLILSKKRQKLISKIYYYYKMLYNKSNGIIEVEIKLPFEIPEDKIYNVINSLEEKFQTKIKIKNLTIDPEIIGGILIVSDDTILDLSIKKELDKLLKDFKQIVNEKINL
ncbi:MAG: ATP synthase F1 subunit delta [bacterium]